MTETVKPYCVYCGERGHLHPSVSVPDGTLYPGPQFKCADFLACIHRIQDRDRVVPLDVTRLWEP
jgi:hypothetical protein